MWDAVEGGRIDGLDVLVVDDDDDSLELTALALRSHGASVRTARDAEVARKALRMRAPDVIICDLGLPVEDGYRFLRSIRSDPTTSGIRAIALSGRGSTAIEEAYRAGFQMSVPKPAYVEDLVAAITRVLGEDA